MANESSGGLAEKSVGLRGDWIASITNVARTPDQLPFVEPVIGRS
jgi:hypothetical protein